MTHSALGNSIYLSLFLIHMLLPVNATAENEESTNFFTEQEITNENLDADVSSESEEDIIEDTPLKIESEEPFFSFS